MRHQATAIFIPYHRLSVEATPLRLCDGMVEATIQLESSGGDLCQVVLPPSLKFCIDGAHSTRILAARTGTAFEIEYNGTVSEIRIGRRIIVTDA